MDGESVTGKTSVVMATYNGTRFLEAQLDSIRLQTYAPQEVIIADDCSNDATADFVENYIKHYNLTTWHITRNIQNVGYKRNFYQAIKSASGDLIFLCDQDDVWNLDKIETMQKIMQRNKNISVLNAAVSCIDAKGNLIAIKNRPFCANNNFVKFSIRKNALVKVPLNEITVRNVTPGCAMCFRGSIAKEFVETYNFDLPHDHFINILGAVLHDGCYFYNSALIQYRIHENNAIGVDVNAKSSRDAAKNYKVKLFYSEMGIWKSLCVGKLEEEKARQYLRITEKRIRFYDDASFANFLKEIFEPSFFSLYNYRQALQDARLVFENDPIK